LNQDGHIDNFSVSILWEKRAFLTVNLWDIGAEDNDLRAYVERRRREGEGREERAA
jgi:hypothetical protein